MDIQSTKNIKFCAYLRLMNIHPIEVVKMDRGRAEYNYAVPSKEWEMHQVQFNQSKFLDYANNLEAIKDLAY
jgi:hypothetical protein